MIGTLGLLAHVGRGLGGFWDGVLHPFTGVDHLLAMVAVGVLAAVVADRRIAWATPAAFVGGMVLGGAAGIAGFEAGFVETAIALSIVVLGGLIALTTVASRSVGAWVPALALGFGALHGVAHGAEAPASASPVRYVLGFVAATVVLHVSGVLLGTAVGRRRVAVGTLAGAVSAAGVMILTGLPT